VIGTVDIKLPDIVVIVEYRHQSVTVIKIMPFRVPGMIQPIVAPAAFVAAGTGVIVRGIDVLHPNLFIPPDRSDLIIRANMLSPVITVSLSYAQACFIMEEVQVIGRRPGICLVQPGGSE